MHADELLLSNDGIPTFMGEFERGLDSKGRFTLPASFREALGDEGAVLTRGLDGCLFLFPKSYFITLRQKLRQLTITRQKDRMIRRLFFSGASQINPDGQGRVIIPAALRRYAGIDGSVVLTGNDTYIELWDAKRWSEMVERFEQDSTQAEFWNDVLV